MAQITIAGGASYECAADDTLLRAGLRAGLGLPYECNAGGCGTCKVEVVDGAVENMWPDAPALSDRDRRKGRVLACQCRPQGDCTVKLRLDPACVPPVSPRRLRARLVGVMEVTHDIRSFRFHTAEPAHFMPGQYVMVSGAAGVERAYSLANCPNEVGEWEVMVRRVPEGRMSNALFDAPPQEVTLDGPFGLATLQPGERDIVCLAGGSGLAPMVSIARGVAQNAADRRRVIFFHGGRTRRDILDEARLRAMTGLDERLVYRPALSEEDVDGLTRGFLHEVAQNHLHADIDAYDYYCAGPPPMTQALEEWLVRQQGLPASRVRFDRFF
ncbi:2Fe-2S iron-sulfur cluster-binding protein [Xanthobacter sp. TB0139]|uniref:2Fe-2S iron-sulfur cluster-binding protein n=1 Tax=Xanthobacter sp. TB0139 TaxID=3459178 RepID=UPI004039F3AA